MSAFSRGTYSDLCSAAKKVSERLHSTNPQPVISLEAVVDMLAAPEHRKVLKTLGTFAAAGRNYNANNATVKEWPGLDFLMVFHANTWDDDKPYFPLQPKVQLDADPQLVESITAWARRRMEIGVDCGRIRRVIEILDERCKSPSQVRYVWPCLMSLYKMSGAEVPEQLLNARVPRQIPQLPAEVREACRKTASTITTAMLFDEVSEKELLVEIKLPARKVKEEGVGTFEALV